MNRYSPLSRLAAPTTTGIASVHLGSMAPAQRVFSTDTPGRILLIESIQRWRDQLVLCLQQAGFSVVAKADGLSGLLQFRQEATFDLVLIGSDTPGLSGLSICTHLRQYSRVPVILLSDFCDIDYIVHTLQQGADDCINRATPWPIVQARIQAIIHRVTAKQQPLSAHTLVCAGLVFDRMRGTVTVHDQPVDLTPIETRLLLYLIERAERPVNTIELLEQVWGYADSEDNLVRVAIRRLRQKIEHNPQHPTFICTVPGFGYQFGVTAAV